MRLSVHVLRSPDPAPLAHLRANLHPDIHLTFGSDLPSPADYDIFVAGRPAREHLAASPNLKVLVIPWAGLPPETRDLLRDFPHVAVHNLHHNAATAAEMVVTLMLAAAKFIVPADRAFRTHDWTLRYRRPSPNVLMEDKMVLILGYGAIGRRVARACRGLGMNVIGIQRRVPASTDDITDEIYPADTLHDLLPRADVLAVCLPHTPETTGFIGVEELALLPADAVLVNVGRGPIVDEAALYHALRERTLYAAGLDVWYNYPGDTAARSHTPPSTYPFHELDNVVMSPHRAGGSKETEVQRMNYLAALLNTAARREEMPNRVDLQAGY